MTSHLGLCGETCLESKGLFVNSGVDKCRDLPGMQPQAPATALNSSSPCTLPLPVSASPVRSLTLSSPHSQSLPLHPGVPPHNSSDDPLVFSLHRCQGGGKLAALCHLYLSNCTLSFRLHEQRFQNLLPIESKL